MILSNTMFIFKGTVVFYQPTLDITNLTEEDKAILLQTNKTPSDWASYIMAFSSSTATTTVKREEADKSLETAKRRQPIKTPKRVKMKSEDEDQPDIPSLQMPGNVKVDWNELPPSLTKFLEALVQ